MSLLRWRSTVKQHGMKKPCLICGKTLITTPSEVAKGKGKFCSMACYSLSKKGKPLTVTPKVLAARKKRVGTGAPRWAGGITRHSKGYTLVYSSDHPRAHKNYVYEHILVVEKSLGRFLLPHEEIHHLNSDKSDNRLENLHICQSRQEHVRLDLGWWKEGSKWFKKCPYCKLDLEVNQENFWRRSNGQFIHVCKSCGHKRGKKTYKSS